jgi:hypothetical protein
MKTIIFLLLLVFSATNLYTQDYRDKYVGTYHCQRKKDNSGSITWSSVNLFISKSFIDSLKINITDSSFLYDPPGQGYDTITHYYGYYTSIIDRFDITGIKLGGFCQFFPNNDSLFMFILGMPGGGGGQHFWYHYFGKRIFNSAVNDEVINNNPIKTYPNPVNTKLFIQVPETYQTSIAKYQVFDYTGKSVIIENPNPEGYIDLSNLSKGIYFLKIDLNNSVYCKKIIKN